MNYSTFRPIYVNFLPDKSIIMRLERPRNAWQTQYNAPWKSRSDTDAESLIERIEACGLDGSIAKEPLYNLEL